MAITTAEFIQNIVTFIRDTLRTNLCDPLINTPNTSRQGKYVMTSYPKRQTQYPLVTVKLTGADTEKMGMSSEIHFCTVSIEVRAWSRNSKESDDMAQDVINTLRQFQYGTNSTDDEEIFGYRVVSVNPVVEELNDATIHSKVMTFEYKAILSG